ncbi:arylsulfatase [Bacteroides sp. 51]|uniref:arylsulfatase n=1 Tax=Bacteroides sp. 51 TaxID=2302938 RepID=UPI0013D1CE91|nr:arylsulfatase [Bacteroides sp. 51]NDV81742.1 arylsulfatase [Bacteroides sp. 51]
MKGKNILATVCAFSGAGLISVTAQDRPNIILIMSDDMGYSDIGCYGGVIETPALDNLANKGLQYMQFYNTARSCPSRASLMTGLHPHQTGIGHMTDNRGEDGYRGDLNNSCVTIGEVLKSNGYETFAVGKWHMTRFMKKDGTKHNWPLQRGFDHYYGTIAGGGSFYDPQTLCRGNEYITPENDPEYKPETFYYTNAITDNAIKFLEKRNDRQPFFMYVAYTSAHWPMQVLEEDIEPYKGRFDQGWEELRKEKYKKMQQQGILDKKWALSIDETVGKWDEAKDKKFETRLMEVYAGMVSNLDKNIGRLVSYLERTNQLENTIIVFLQDNGGCAEPLGRQPQKPTAVKVPQGKELIPMEKDELQTRLIPYRTRDGRPVMQGVGTMAGGPDTYIAYGKGWAYASNTPFREYKHWVHEGGISTPLIVHWPARIKASKNNKRWQPGQLPDIMATFLDASQSTYPETFKGIDITPYQGISLMPSFSKDKFNYTRPLYWEHEGNRAIRSGKWKLVYKSAHEETEDIPLSAWSLYDMENDRTEQHDLAAKYPERVKEMAAQWEEFAIRCHVKPWPHQLKGPANH